MAEIGISELTCNIHAHAYHPWWCVTRTTVPSTLHTAAPGWHAPSSRPYGKPSRGYTRRSASAVAIPPAAQASSSCACTMPRTGGTLMPTTASTNSGVVKGSRAARQ